MREACVSLVMVGIEIGATATTSTLSVSTMGTYMSAKARKVRERLATLPTVIQGLGFRLCWSWSHGRLGVRLFREL